MHISLRHILHEHDFKEVSPVSVIKPVTVRYRTFPTRRPRSPPKLSGRSIRPERLCSGTEWSLSNQIHFYSKQLPLFSPRSKSAFQSVGSEAGADSLSLTVTTERGFALLCDTWEIEFFLNVRAVYLLFCFLLSVNCVCWASGRVNIQAVPPHLVSLDQRETIPFITASYKCVSLHCC